MQDRQQELYYAIFFDSKEEVARLLLDPSIDPTADLHFSLWLACELNREKIVKLLLEDGRADPAFDNCFVLKKAHRDRFWKIEELLAQDERTSHLRWYSGSESTLEAREEHTLLLERLRSGLGDHIRRQPCYGCSIEEALPTYMQERVDRTWLYIKARWCRADAREDKEYYTQFQREYEAHLGKPIVVTCRSCGRGYSQEMSQYTSISHGCTSCDFYCQPTISNPRNSELVKYYGIDPYSDQELPRELTSKQWRELDYAYDRWKCNMDEGKWTGDAEHDPRLETNADLRAYYGLN